MTENISTAILKGENICKSYGKQKVLENLNITINSGCIYGLIGRNGVGKTTLLGALTGQNTVNSGDVTYNGETVWENKKVLENICFSREIGATIGTHNNPLQIKDYLLAGEIYYPNWDKEMANTLVEKFKLVPKKRIAKLSKGQMSMLTIIVALASGAPMTILDEPAAGLDVVAREQFYRLLLDEFTKTQRTFIVSTHIIEEAAGVFERVLIMADGKIIEDELTEDLTVQFRFVSGNEDELNNHLKSANKLQILGTESLGKHKMLAVRADEETFNSLENAGFAVENMTLQNVFVSLCGRE